jgi:hypothetical protein
MTNVKCVAFISGVVQSYDNNVCIFSFVCGVKTLVSSCRLWSCRGEKQNDTVESALLLLSLPKVVRRVIITLANGGGHARSQAVCG